MYFNYKQGDYETFALFPTYYSRGFENKVIKHTLSTRKQWYIMQIIYIEGVRYIGPTH